MFVQKNREIGRQLFSAFCAGVGIGAILLGGVNVAHATARPADKLTVDAFMETLKRVQDHYVDAVDINKLGETAIKAAVGQLDPFSEYLSPAEYRALLEDTEGRFVGIGVSVEKRDQKIIVLSVISKGPAARAGILAGDELISVDGHALRSLTLSQVSQMIRGSPGSTVLVQTQRVGLGQPTPFRIVRALVDVNPVSQAWIGNDIFYVRVDRFSEGVGDRLQDLLQNAEKRMRGLILDLRDNGGGLFSEALDVADLFLERGVIVTTRGKKGVLLKQFTASRRGTLDYRPMVVLVNQNTASAAEIVAVAMRDYKRATLVGAKTFGKGSVQEVVELPNGGALKLTIARYYSPSGSTIDHKGVRPDVAIEGDELHPSLINGNGSAELGDDIGVKRALENLAAKKQPSPAAPASGN